MIVLDVCGSPIEMKCIIELKMIDGKIQTILSGATNSSQCCSVCGVSPKIMNSLDILNKEYTYREFKYGLSSLHAWSLQSPCMVSPISMPGLNFLR